MDNYLTLKEYLRLAGIQYVADLSGTCTGEFEGKKVWAKFKWIYTTCKGISAGSEYWDADEIEILDVTLE